MLTQMKMGINIAGGLWLYHSLVP